MGSSKQHFKTVFLSSLGGGLEFYDFVIFAVLGPYLSYNFFPVGSKLVALMATFSVFAVGYLIRPLGGIWLSHFGDKYGRKKTFALSISMMAVSTFLLGIIPTYHSLGILATILFILLRLIQGIALGGEIPGAITFVYEHVSHRPATACGVVFLFINSGTVLANVVHMGLLHFFTEEAVYAYAWRFAFIFGGLLAIVSYYLRTQLTETPEFEQSKDKPSLPIAVLVNDYKREFLIGFILAGFGAVLITLYALFLPTYMSQILGYTAQESAEVPLLFLCLLSVSIPFIGYIADSLPINRLMLFGLITFSVLNYYLYVDIVNHLGYVYYWMTAIGLLAGTITGTFPCIIAKIFPTSIRYTGVAACYNIGFALFGGLAPLIATTLLNYGYSVYAPLWILEVMACSAIVVSLYIEIQFGKISSRPNNICYN